MPKEIRCDKCNALVAVLEKGSKWKTGSLVLCPKHTEELKKKEFADKFKDLGNKYQDMKMDSFMDGLFGRR
jgi:hypothetical protein